MRWPDPCPVCETLKPRSFAALMELYEQNYLRVRCLFPLMQDMQGVYVSHASGCLRLRVDVLEQSRHTTTLHLSYMMSDNESRPDVEVRVYHDALQAEILNCGCSLSKNIYRLSKIRDPETSALLCKWKLNRFLYKWLNYLQRQGHGFAEDRLPQPFKEAVSA